ncbi:helix-turn-helix domain-containing protein [Halomonas sp. LBP4]|uniref:helix-turn-helix domain-containing protein n=1 Tax=Halomonas sp. LBP4 TaxID=2044917 RepID=UPI000D76EBFB|nr:helix-turn-helix domain-containing protein [Halomonas sp. LBP4]PXX97358.1 hypothetical protein CR157_11535 [Halomonas sp. LBP4]
MTTMKKPRGQAGANSNSKAQIDPTSHMGRVLAALQQGPMSAAELQWGLRIAHAPAAVRDLRRKGIRIDGRDHPHPSRPGEKIKRYHLVGEG